MLVLYDRVAFSNFQRITQYGFCIVVDVTAEVVSVTELNVIAKS